jgi:hypothetical protein
LKFTKRNDALVNGIRPGFSDRDSHFLNRQTHTPKTQIWSAEELESEEPEDRTYYCALCKGILDYDKRLEAYTCKACVQWYDMRIQDLPLKDIKDFQLVPYGEQRHYRTFDENDSMTPFVESVPLDQMAEEESVETRSYDNGRVQKIKIKGSFADAMQYSRVMSAKKKEDDDQ